MSLLTELPHRCTIYRRVRSRDSLGGNTDSRTTLRTNVECWEQGTSTSETKDFEKRGMQAGKKIYFVEDPGVDERCEIAVTTKMGVAVSNPVAYDVLSEATPDASAGLEILFRVMVGKNLGSLQ